MELERVASAIQVTGKAVKLVADKVIEVASSFKVALEQELMAVTKG